MPLGHQHALHFAQHLMRIGVEFERMRHHHEIDAVGGKGQIMQIGAHLREAVVATVVATQAQGHAVGAQKIMIGQGQLHRIEAEYIGDQRVVLPLFPVEHILAGGRT